MVPVRRASSRATSSRTYRRRTSSPSSRRPPGRRRRRSRPPRRQRELRNRGTLLVVHILYTHAGFETFIKVLKVVCYFQILTDTEYVLVVLLNRSGYTDHPLSSIRSVIAQRLTASKQTSPHGHATAASDIGAVIRHGHVRLS